MKDSRFAVCLQTRQPLKSYGGQASDIPTISFFASIRVNAWFDCFVVWLFSFSPVAARYLSNSRRQTKTAATAPAKSAHSPAKIACRIRVIPTDPKYTAIT